MNREIIEISTIELLNRLNNPDFSIIDIRPVEAYNGWKLNSELRGGHIKGAKSLPNKWTNYLDWIEIVRSKHILPENNIVLYGYTDDESKKAAKFFSKAGYKNIWVYNLFIDEWLANEDLPVETLTRYRQLVSADWVNKLISGKKPAE